MATKNIVPRADNEGSLGTDAKRWATAKIVTTTGNLVGNVTGNVTGDLTGNADTATTLAGVLSKTLGGAGDVSGILKANGSGTVSAAVSGTDYSGGTSALATGIVKSTTTTGALTIAAGSDLLSTHGTQTANTVLSGPTTGAAANPTFRALVAADMPSESSTRAYYAYGDSITLGTGASDTAHAYTYLLAAAQGLTQTNKAEAGTQILNQAYHFFTTTVAEGDISTILTGYNDARYVGDASLQLSTYQNALAACLAWSAIPTSLVIQGQAAGVATTGSVGTYSGYTGTMIRTLLDQNGTATATVYGTTAYACIIKDNQTEGVTYSVSVDGVTVATGAADDIVTTNTVTPRTWGPCLIRIPNLTNGNHTVVITKTDATAGALMVGWFAGNGEVTQGSGATIYVGNTLGMTPTGYAVVGVANDTIIAEYNVLIAATVGNLQRDGLRVRLVDANRVYNPYKYLDGTHPNDAGHAIIAKAFEAEMAPWRSTSSAFVNTDAAHVSGTFPSVTSSGIVRGNTVAGTTTSAAVVGIATTTGAGGYFTSDGFVGVNGVSNSNSGVRGISTSGNGGYFTSTSDMGVQGVSSSSYGGKFASTSGIGMHSTSSSSTAVYGTSATGTSGRFDQTGASLALPTLLANRSAASAGTGPVLKLTDASGTSSSGDLVYGETKQSSTTAVRFRVTKLGDVVINDATAGVVMKSANAHYWRLAVADDGTLSAADLGTSAP